MLPQHAKKKLLPFYGVSKTFSNVVRACYYFEGDVLYKHHRQAQLVIREVTFWQYSIEVIDT